MSINKYSWVGPHLSLISATNLYSFVTHQSTYRQTDKYTPVSVYSTVVFTVVSISRTCNMQTAAKDLNVVSETYTSSFDIKPALCTDNLGLLLENHLTKTI